MEISAQPEPEIASDDEDDGPDWIMRAVVGLAVLVCALIASNVLLWMNERDARSERDESEQNAAEVVQGLNRLLDRVARVEVALGALGNNADDVISDLEAGVDDAQSSVDDLRDCVNEFLRAVDASVGGSYRFRFCF